MADPLACIERARVEIARLKGWTSRGAHDRAAQALDKALAAIADAKASIHALPFAREALDATCADLERLTGGSL